MTAIEKAFPAGKSVVSPMGAAFLNDPCSHSYFGYRMFSVAACMPCKWSTNVNRFILRMLTMTRPAVLLRGIASVTTFNALTKIFCVFAENIVIAMETSA